MFLFQYHAPDYLKPLYENMPMPPAHRDVVINAFVFVHLSLHQANSRVSKRGGRTMAITPRHYLDFINHFVSLPLLLYSILLGKVAIMSRLMEGHYFGGIPSFMQIRTMFYHPLFS